MTDDSSESLQPDSLIDGRFRVVRLLGRGGMGAVYEARNSLKRRFAIKVMRPEVARNADYARRFLQEAQAASQLAHPNIVDVIEMGEDKALGVLYIVQEFLTGHDLRAHMTAAGRFQVNQALEVIVPVMEALVMAHARGVVHRDLKPENIFLAETARGIEPKIIDFGIAKVVGDDGGSLQKTGTGTTMGTPDYMAPEQASGDSGLDGRADVWAIGVLLYEMLSGAMPYEANTANVLIAKILYEDPRALADAAPDLPADLVGAVMGALRRDRSQRYPSMQAFLDALRAWAPAAGVAKAGDAHVWTPSSDAPTIAASTPAPPPANQPGISRDSQGGTFAPSMTEAPPLAGNRGRTRKLAGLGLLAVGALLGVLYLGRGGADVTSHSARAPAASTPVAALALEPRPAAPTGALAAPTPAPAAVRAAAAAPEAPRAPAEVVTGVVGDAPPAPRVRLRGRHAASVPAAGSVNATPRVRGDRVRPSAPPTQAPSSAPSNGIGVL